MKRIFITGVAPFDIYQYQNMQPFLSYFVSPTSTVVLEWTGIFTLVPNEVGGRTAMYNFRLSGEDSLSWKYLESFKENIKVIGGTIESDGTIDPED
jgi:hypothetical protein